MKKGVYLYETLVFLIFWYVFSLKLFLNYLGLDESNGAHVAAVVASLTSRFSLGQKNWRQAISVAAVWATGRIEWLTHVAAGLDESNG